MRVLFSFLFLVITGRFRNAFEVVRHLKLGTQLAFVGLGLGSYVVHQYPRELFDASERAYYAAKLAVRENSDGIPVSHQNQERLADAINTLKSDLTTEFMRRGLGVAEGYNTWAVAQTAVALGATPPIDGSDVKRFFEENIDEECNCWRETPQKQPNTGATSWTIFAMSEVGVPAPPGVIDSLLKLQSREGWWPLYPARAEPKSASTYSTAWSTLALCSQVPLQAQAKDGVEVARIKRAIENSLNWLDKNEIVPLTRWLDYPANSPSFKSVSISGLIVHLVHECGGSRTAERLFRNWLDHLPVDITSATTTEASNAYITLASGALDFDRTRYYVLQWALMATVDSYSSGSLNQRSAALQWIERILGLSLVSPEVRNQNWVAAELLYALKHLQRHVVATRIPTPAS